MSCPFKMDAGQIVNLTYVGLDRIEILFYNKHPQTNRFEELIAVGVGKIVGDLSRAGRSWGTPLFFLQRIKKSDDNQPKIDRFHPYLADHIPEITLFLHSHCTFQFRIYAPAP